MVLPGVGAFGPCAQALAVERSRPAGPTRPSSAGVPFLGICVGFQLLYEGSDESPTEHGLGILDGVVRRLPAGVKQPQMQWNRLDLSRPPTPVPAAPGCRSPWVYFVHSYAPSRPAPTSSRPATTADR